MRNIGKKALVGLIMLGVLAASACGAPASAPAQQSAAPSVSPSASASPSTAASAGPSASAKSAAPSASPSAYDKAMEGWDKIVAEAKKEGKVVLYANPTEDTSARLEAFEKANLGVKVEMVGLRGSESKARLEAEVKAGKGLGDVVLAGQSSSFQMADNGDFTPWLAPAALKPGMNWIIAPYSDRFRPNGETTPVNSYTSTGLVINTDLVPANKEPKTWDDLLDPFFKDKSALQPLNQAAGLEVFNFIISKRPNKEAFAAGVKALNPSWSSAIDEQIRLVITGDKAVYWPVSNANVTPYLLRKDLPIKFIAPKPSVVGTSLHFGISKVAPHPNAAKVFINWLLTEEGQAAQAKNGVSVLLKGATVSHPALDLGSDVYKGVEVYYPTRQDFDHSAAATKEATALFGLQ